MSVVDIQDRALAQRFPASFAGLPFEVGRATFDSSNNTVEDLVLGRGSATRFVVAGRVMHALQGWIGLEDTGVPQDDQLRLVPRIQALHDALQLRRDGNTSGVLVHPWFGVLDVVPESWSFELMRTRIQHAEFRVLFGEAELPEETTAVAVAGTPDGLRIELAEVGALLAFEPAPAAQMEQQRAALAIPGSVQGEDYTREATARLLNGGNVATPADIPTAIRSLGRTARAAAVGELTQGDRDQTIREVRLAAQRYNSWTIADMLEPWLLYLGELGVNAFGRVVERPLRSLQALGGDFEALARRNRDAVENWVIANTARI